MLLLDDAACCCPLCSLRSVSGARAWREGPAVADAAEGRELVAGMRRAAASGVGMYGLWFSVMSRVRRWVLQR